MDLTPGTVAVVTGAASGIGRALSDAFGRAGCAVVMADVDPVALSTAAGEVAATGAEVLAVPTDVAKAEQVGALATATIDRFGAAHVVCNNAGVTGAGDPWFGPIEGWEWTMGVNFWGVVHGVRAFLPHLVAAGRGHVVNTASILGLMPAISPTYDASKHAVVALTEDLYHAMQTAGLPIGVTCVCPGWVRTGIVESDRNWPSELGPKPAPTAASEVTRRHVAAAVDEGVPPAVIADQVLDAVRRNRYWVLPSAEFFDLAVERFHRIADGADPVAAERLPSMPPRADIVAEAMAALAAEMATTSEDGS